MKSSKPQPQFQQEEKLRRDRERKLNLNQPPAESHKETEHAGSSSDQWIGEGRDRRTGDKR